MELRIVLTSYNRKRTFRDLVLKRIFITCIAIVLVHTCYFSIAYFHESNVKNRDSYSVDISSSEENLAKTQPDQSITDAGVMKEILENETELVGWPRNKSREMTLYIDFDHVTTILSPRNICSSNPELLIMVASAPKSEEFRNGIRDTWGNKTYIREKYQNKVVIAFLTGLVDSKEINESLINESMRHNDIVQDKFYDSYNNLTLKSVVILKWALNECRTAKYVLKTDDDVYLNIPLILRTLQDRKKVPNTLFGHKIDRSPVISDPKNKWYMPKYFFAAKEYPPYIFGLGYVMSMDVVEKLFRIAHTVPFLHIEDVYLTGLCAIAAGINSTHESKFFFDMFNYSEGKKIVPKDNILAHRVGPIGMLSLWNQFQDLNFQKYATNLQF